MPLVALLLISFATAQTQAIEVERLFPEGCLPILPMAETTRDNGIVAVQHNADPSGQPGFESKPAQGVLRMDSSSPTRIPKMLHSKGVQETWVIGAGLGFGEGTPDWLKAGPDGQAEGVAPKSLEGAVLQIAGQDIDGEWVVQRVAFGDAALRNLAAFEHHYLRLRRLSIGWPFADPAPATVGSIDPQIAALIRFDLDGDGGDDLLGFTVTAILDTKGEILAESGELGVVWSEAGKPPGTVGFALEQGQIFPEFQVAPAKLNDGRRLLFSAIRCCDGVSVRAFHIDGHRFKAIAPILRSGPYAVCLRPGGGPGSPFVLERPR
jgi:hypothetical protein